MTDDQKEPKGSSGRRRKQLNIASYIDQALLKPEVTVSDVEKLCHEAAEYKFKVVFVNPYFIRLCRNLLEGTGVHIGSVAGFPLGATTTEVKVYEAETGENSGAEEIDMVVNIGAIKSGQYDFAAKDVISVKKSLSSRTILKVIIECSLLTNEEKIRTAEIVARSGADFVKTSTGLLGGATLEDVTLLYETVGRKIGVKASGGIRTLEQALKMIEAGASRIGTSSGAAIVDEQKKRQK